METHRSARACFFKESMTDEMSLGIGLVSGSLFVVGSLECSDLLPEAEAEAESDGLDDIGVDRALESGVNPIRKRRVGSESESCRGGAMPPAKSMRETGDRMRVRVRVRVMNFGGVRLEKLKP